MRVTDDNENSLFHIFYDIQEKRSRFSEVLFKNNKKKMKFELLIVYFIYNICGYNNRC